jgi:anti-anti-sigma regulatory factor
MLAVLFKHRIGMTDGTTHAPIAPSNVLDRANRHVRHECRAPGLFLTAAYCLLDMQACELTVASAGHPPLILLRADGQQEMIYHTGPALGLVGDASFAQRTVHLHPGDRVLLYTDGLYDVAAERNRPAGSQIAELLAGMEGDGRGVLRRLLDLAAERRGNGGQEDDITALLLSAGVTTSSIDNGAPTRSAAEPPLPPGAEVLVGTEGEATSVSVAGRGTWLHCAGFSDACLAAVESGCPLTVDLSLCEYLDSTFLGTLQEITDRAEEGGVALRIQGVLPSVRALFEELGMASLLRHVSDEMQPLPTQMSPLSTDLDEEANRRRMLLAHQSLATLNEQNQREFARLVAHLRAEVEELGAAEGD